jgi:hypothetical protein
MVARHLSRPHKFVCVDETPGRVPDGVEGLPMPPLQRGDFACTRRLWHFSPEATVLGERVVHLDLDVVITAPLDPLFERAEPLVLWKCESKTSHGWALNPTVMLFTPGTRTDIWRQYVSNPTGLMDRAHAAGFQRKNSDQCVLSYLLSERHPHWTHADGIVSYRMLANSALPTGARVVSFHGHSDPNDDAVRARSPWVNEAWR